MMNSICDEAEITTDDRNRSSGLINEQAHCDGLARPGAQAPHKCVIVELDH